MPQPVAAFLRQSLLLNTAIELCLDNPKPKPVHRLRSTTRRLEATLELLKICSDIRGLGTAAKPFKKNLRRVRRAAGEVRDLDVHRDLLVTYKRSFAKDTAILDKTLTEARQKAAQKLQQCLQKEQSKIRDTFTDLESALQPAVDLDLSGARLTNEAQHWLARAIRHLDPQEDDQLHTIRKTCKTARYIAEIGSETSRSAAALASSLEKLQEAAGNWHDHLVLLEEAKDTLAKDSPLIRRIQEDVNGLRHKAESAAKRRLTGIQKAT